MDGTPFASAWPEQDVVDAWLGKFDIKVTHEQAMLLKQAVTAPRLALQKLYGDAAAVYPADWARLVLMVAPDGAYHAIGGQQEPSESDQPLPAYTGLERLRKSGNIQSKTYRRKAELKAIVQAAVKTGDFTLASGRRSTFYFDGRLVTLNPEGLRLVAEDFLDTLAGYPEITAVGGMAIGADPITGAVVALGAVAGRNLSGFMVRKEPKGHGTGKLVEGVLRPGQQVAIIEDTITTGGSALKAAEAVMALGAKPVLVLAILDREEGGREALEADGLAVRCLFTKTDLMGEGDHG